MRRTAGPLVAPPTPVTTAVARHRDSRERLAPLGDRVNPCGEGAGDDGGAIADPTCTRDRAVAVGIDHQARVRPGRRPARVRREEATNRARGGGSGVRGRRAASGGRGRDRWDRSADRDGDAAGGGSTGCDTGADARRGRGPPRQPRHAGGPDRRYPDRGGGAPGVDGGGGTRPGQSRATASRRFFTWSFWHARLRWLATVPGARPRR